MAKVPYYTSETLVEAVRRRASLPRAESMFSDDDILEFANDEILEHVVPMIKSTHEEFFVWLKTISIEGGKELYKIPEKPDSADRYKNHDLSIFREYQISFVKEMGFEV